MSTQGEKHLYTIMKVKQMEYYFSDKQLLKVLSRKRALLAKKEHDKLFHKSLLVEKNPREINQLLYEIFPSRNSWIRLDKKQRKGKSAVDINTSQIERTVLRDTKRFQSTPIHPWQVKLYDLIEDIKSKALSGNYSIPSPIIHEQFKEEKNDIKIYRPIANYEYIDRIIISQCNKYLTHCFDPYFMDCSYAFRSKQILNKSFSHHKAIEDIIDYKKQFKTTDLWVSECDIKKFFDCVNHEVVKSTFDNKVKECNDNGLDVDERAIDLFNSYLASYSFNENVKNVKLPEKSEFGWVTEAELASINSNIVNDKIGVPQGGAISCLIANLLMDVVDKEVLKNNTDGNLFYARFCDDMVLMHPNFKICSEALSSYDKGLKEVKLLSHEPVDIQRYSNKFWKSKSKLPYKWALNLNNESTKKNVPWLSFVGYQISSDLKVRVRKSSTKKEIEKQVSETDKVISLLRKGKKFRISEKAIKYRLTQRLLAMSVGRKNIFDIDKEGQMCWTAGFRVLKKNEFVKFQLKHLDKKRGAQISRLENHLKKMNKKKRPNKNKKLTELEKEPKYYGSPYSYYYQFK